MVIDDAADRLLSSATPAGHAAFNRFVASLLKEPVISNPAIAAQRLPGLFPVLAQSCAKLDVVKAIYRRHDSGALLAWEADRGWVSSNLTRSQTVALALDTGWHECQPFSVSSLPHVFSLESLLWMSCLRWRHVLPAYPDDVCVAIDEFPDLPSVTQQQYLFEALLRWRRPLSKSAVGSAVALNGNMADAALFASALTVGVQRELRVVADGALVPFSLPVRADVAAAGAMSEMADAPFAGAIRRLARFFGLRSAASA